jgi:hypothetical protein
MGADFQIEKGADGKAQSILPGAQKSARQAAQAREDRGRGMMLPKIPQKPPGGLFTNAETYQI